jgi:ABC-type transport system substrate-binding protein
MVFVGDQNPPGLSGIYPITTVGVNNARLVEGRLLRDGIPYGSFEPDLAESYEISDDNLVYTFHLREGVTWHDGEPFNAEDVMFTWDLYMNPEAGFSGHGYWPLYVKDYRMIDDYTVELELKSVYAPALYRFANSATILPKHILENVPAIELKSNSFNKMPIGTGPFKVVEWVDDEYIKYEAFDDFWRGPPGLDEILFRIMPDKATGIAALEAGEVNLIEQQIYRGALIQNNDRLKDDADLTITVSPDTGVNPMLINLKHPALGNLNVRKALAHAIDIEAIIEGPYAGLGVKTPQRYPPIMEPYFNPQLTHYEYNIDTAKQLMEEAGYHYSSLEQTTTPTPSETQNSILLPAAISLIIGAVIGFAVDRFILKK